MNHHHGMQSEERFGLNTDPDGHGVPNELTVADITAISMFQATMAVPGRVIPDDRAVERAILNGQRSFYRIGCQSCHTDAWPLDRPAGLFSSRGPLSPVG